MGQVSGTQLWMVHSIYVFTSAIGFLLGPLVEAAGFGSWQPVLFGSITGTVLAVLAVRFGLRRPDAHFGMYGGSILGKWPHRVCMFIFAFYFLYLDAYVLREFGDAMIGSYLFGTPLWALGAVTLICMVSLANSGFPSIFHFTQGAFIFVMALFISKPLFLGFQVNWDMMPAFITHWDLQKNWAYSITVTPWYGELILFLFFIPYFRRGSKLTRSMWLAAGTGTYILISELVVIILLFGPELAGRMSYPALETARFVQLGDFMENLDPIIVFIWLSSLLVKMSLLFCTGVTVLAQLLQVKEAKLLHAPTAGLVLGMSVYMADSTADLRYFFGHAWPLMALLIQSLPLLYMTVDTWRSRGRRTGKSPEGQPLEES